MIFPIPASHWGLYQGQSRETENHIASRNAGPSHDGSKCALGNAFAFLWMLSCVFSPHSNMNSLSYLRPKTNVNSLRAVIS